MNIFESIKWHLIVGKSMITSKTVVNFMGKTYLVSGNIVKKFGE